MKFRYCLIILLSIFLYSFGFITGAAQKVVTPTDRLYTPDMIAWRSNTSYLPVNMDNMHDITAVQFNIGIPRDMKVEANAFRLSERATDHVIQSRFTQTKDSLNWYLVMIYSPSNATFIGRTGKILDIKFTMSEEAAEGDKLWPALSDGVMSTPQKENVLRESNVGSISIEYGPDLVIPSIIIESQDIAPNGTLNLGWSVTNTGDMACQAGWSEEISLIDGGATTDDYSGFTTRYLGVVRCEEELEGHATLSRNTSIQLPALIGIDGECRIMVRIVPFPESNERPESRINNTTVSKQTVKVAKSLTLNLSQQRIAENSRQRISATLSRSGRWDQEETFRLNVSGDSRVSVPTSVTLPTGQSAARFDIDITDNDVLDDLGLAATITVSDQATVDAYEPQDVQLTVEDDEMPKLSLSASSEEISEGETITFSITAERAPLEDLILHLSCDHANRFEYTDEIVLAAGETTVTVNVLAKDDNTPAVTEFPTFTISAENYLSDQAYPILNDNDIPSLSLTLTPTTLSEGAGPVAMMGILRRTTNIDKDITVKLSDNAERGDINYGQFSTIRMAKGVEEVQFSIGINDNLLVDGDRDITITAAVFIQSCSCSPSGESAGVVTQDIHVMDNDGNALSLSSNVSTIKEGGELTIILKRNVVDAGVQTVNISIDQSESFEYPSTVTFDAGETETSFVVKSKSDDQNIGTFSAMVTAESEDYAKGLIWFNVSEQTLADAQISEIKVSETEVEVGKPVKVEITVANTGVYALSAGVPVIVYLDGRQQTAQSLSALGVGETETVTCVVEMPSTIGSHNIHAVVNGSKAATELQYNNNTSATVSVNCISPFNVTINTDKQLYAQGETVNITGTIQGSSINNQALEIYLISDGIRHTLSATTSADGTFSTTFKPSGGLMGRFSVGACYPGENLRDEMCTFDYYGLRMSQTYATITLTETETYKGSFTLTNPGTKVQTGLSLVSEVTSENCDITFDYKKDFAAGETITVEYTIVANAKTEGANWQEMPLSISTNEGSTQKFILYYFVQSQRAALYANTTNINTTMCISEVRDYPITLTNIGKVATGDITLSLPSFIKSNMPTTMNSLEADESVTIMLSFVPTSDMVVNVPVYGQLGINCENGDGLAIKYHITPVSNTNGTIEVDVVDEYTFYTPEAPHISNAEVKIINPATNAIVAEGKTGDDGIFSASIPEGLYDLRVSADNHDSYTNSLILDPDKTTKQQVFLPYQAVTYTWEVEETEVEDVYVIETVVKYETRVPKPVIIATLPEERPEVNTVLPIVVTNKGLINATNVELSIDCGENYTLEFVNEKTIENLAPQQSHVFYAMLREKETAKKAATRATDSSTKSGTIADCFSLTSIVKFCYKCGDMIIWDEKPVTKMYGNCNKAIANIPANTTGNVTTSNSSDSRGNTGSIGGSFAGGVFDRLRAQQTVSYTLDTSKLNIATKDCSPTATLSPKPIPVNRIDDCEDNPKFVFYLQSTSESEFKPEGVACDGISEVNIIIDAKKSKVPTEDCDYTYEWELPEGTPGELIGSTDSMYGITYKAPKDFPNPEGSAIYTIKVLFNYCNNNTNEKKTQDIKIKLARVPVLLVHGLNSDHTTWNSFMREHDFIEKDYFPWQIFGKNYFSWQIAAADYKINNRESFETNKEVVKDQADEKLIKIYKKKGFVASAIDVVGHSMGGLITKKYIHDHPEDKQFFHKIITVNTPHGGSQLGNFLMDELVQKVLNLSDYPGRDDNGWYSDPPFSRSRDMFKMFAEKYYPNAYKEDRSAYNTGAVNDLSVGSPAIDEINNNEDTKGIPCHAIVTNVDFDDTDFFTELKAANNVVKTDLFGYDHLQALLEDLFNADGTDFVVPIRSQKGGLQGEHIWHEHGGTGYVAGGYSHMSSLKQENVKDQIKYALKASVKNEIFADGFKVVDSLEYKMDEGLEKVKEIYKGYKGFEEDTKSISKRNASNRALQTSTERNVFEYNGYQLSDTIVDIRIVESDGLNNIGFSCSFDGSIIADIDSIAGRVVLPRKAEGSLRILAEGISDNGDTYACTDTLYFNTFNVPVDHISFDTDTLLIFNDYFERPRITCYWTDGDETTCESAQLTITDPSIATVVDGKIYGLTEGKTFVTATYRGATSTIPVYVFKPRPVEDEKSSDAVCSTITLSFKQTMVMTRQAFRGTLTVFNGNETNEMQNVRLNLVVKNATTGEVASSHEFQINAESLKGFDGELDLSAGWTLGGKESGVATILFIPTKYAAPDEPIDYSFGGSFSYTDSNTGLEVTRPLYPVTLTVKPSPELNLTYFMQRDVLGDDPLTQEIEPCEEAEFSLLINNIGKGEATNIRMTTEQPQIIDNQKGLYIDFELISSQLNGEERTLALGKNVTTEFGNIAPGESVYAQWWIKSSLLGHFSEYNVSANHVTSYGNPDLSLLNEVTIHELIRSLHVTKDGKSLRAFLVNDIEDANDTPDMLYLSNGETEHVTTAANALITKISDTEYELTVYPGGNGWNYGNVSDPTYGMAELKSIVRKNNGTEVSTQNFWMTDRTLRDGKDPRYENRIHFADIYAGIEPVTYTLVFDPTPAIWLEIDSLGGIPAEDALITDPVPMILVAFNKPIDPATFSAEDITLTIQGEKQDLTRLNISSADNQTFTLDFSPVNDVLANGYYSLTVQTAGIADNEGFTGKMGKSASWIMYRGGLVSLQKSVYPQLSGSITMQEVSAGAPSSAPQRGRKAVMRAQEEDKAYYGSTLLFVANPSPGNKFVNWTLNGEIISTEPELEYTAICDLNLVANFITDAYSVTVKQAEGGTVTDASGFYGKGETLELTATPNDFYSFSSWIVNGEEYSSDAQLSLIINQTYSITPVFIREIYPQTMNINTGWNWVSGYLREPLPVSAFYLSTNRIVGQYDEIINDKEYGLIGGFESLSHGNSYKIESAKDYEVTFNGHLLAEEETDIHLEEGWNWIGYPYNISIPISASLDNVEEGDYIISQTGFAEFADGQWAGSADMLYPGSGYLYYSASEKDLSFLFTDTMQEARISKAPTRQSHKNSDIIDVYRYPNTMNITARLFEEEWNLSSGRYSIYAMAGNECRGVSQFVDGKYYISVYGDKATDIRFVVEDNDTGDAFLANESITFKSDIVGSRKSPYQISIGKATDITPSLNASSDYFIYNLNGSMIGGSKTNRKTLESLQRGFYIINGHKYIVK